MKESDAKIKEKKIGNDSRKSNIASHTFFPFRILGALLAFFTMRRVLFAAASAVACEHDLHIYGC